MVTKGSIFGLHPDWQAITLCVVAASIFWFFNAMNEDHTADVSYPVEFTYDQEKYIPVEPLPEKIRFNATGFGWNLLRKTLRLNRPPVEIHLERPDKESSLTAGQILPALKTQLEDIKINFLLEDSVPIYFDQVAEKSFRLRIDTLSISLAKGYRITGPVKIEPERIYLRGPKNTLKAISDSFYVTIPETDISSSYNELISLNYPLPPLVSMEPDEVKVEFPVEKFIMEPVTVVPELRNFPQDSSLLPEQPNLILTVLIKPENLEKARQEDWKVSLNLLRINPKDSTIIPKLVDKPGFVREYFFTPEKMPVIQSE